MSKEVGNSNMEAFPMSEELRKLCQINPWLPCADRFYNRPDDGMYVVDSDKPVLEKLRQKQNVLYSKFHFDILPDPLVGNVCASVIVVCLNPGYGSLDKYNYESVDEETKELVRQEYIDSLNELNNRRKIKGKKPFSREIRFIYSGEDEKKQLNFRRKRMVESLKLIPGNRPYALDNSFNSAEIINLKTNNRDGWANSRFGTYNWHRFFMGKYDGKKVFRIEYFPYHSVHLSSNEIDVLEEDYKMAHSKFRDDFFELRLREGAYIIARSNNLRNRILRKFSNYRMQIGCFSSNQASTLSERNIISGEEDYEKDKAFKKQVLALLGS